MTVETTLSIGAEIEHLRIFEEVSVVHIERACHEHKDAVLDRAILHDLGVNFELDFLKSKRFNLLTYLLQPTEEVPVVGHLAHICVEVYQPSSILHQCCVVSLQELNSQLLSLFIHNSQINNIIFSPNIILIPPYYTIFYLIFFIKLLIYSLSSFVESTKK